MGDDLEVFSVVFAPYPVSLKSIFLFLCSVGFLARFPRERWHT